MATFTVKEGIEVQQRHLEDWKLLLKPKAYKLLEAEVIKDNNRAENGYEIVRGVGIDNILANYVLKSLKKL